MNGFTLKCTQEPWGTTMAYKDSKLVFASPVTADSELQNADKVRGAVVVVMRGICSFEEKVQRGAAAGAVGVIVVNNDQENPDQVPNMTGGDFTFPIPVSGVSYHTGNLLAKVDIATAI